MSNGKETEDAVKKQVTAFLLNKPIWVWSVFYVAVTGALFGIFYLAMYLLTFQWWVGVLILLATGAIWGAIKYIRIKGKINAEKTQAAQPA